MHAARCVWSSSRPPHPSAGACSGCRQQASSLELLSCAQWPGVLDDRVAHHLHGVLDVRRGALMSQSRNVGRRSLEG